jgi:hypothetical protein
MLTQLSDLSKEDILNLQFRQILCEYLVLVANIVLARASDNIEISVSLTDFEKVTTINHFSIRIINMSWLEDTQ